MREIKRFGQLLMLGFLLSIGCNLVGGGDINRCSVNSELNAEGTIEGNLILTEVFTRTSVQIYTTDLQGNRIVVTQQDSLFLSQPQLSPDSSKIFVLVDPGITDVGYELYLMNTDGTDFRSAKIFAFNPVWSPDGKYIAYEFCNFCPTGRNSNIYVYSVETDQVSKLTNREFDDAFPSWLPDSKTLLFQSVRDSNNYSLNLFSVDIFSMEVTQLTHFIYPIEAVVPKVNPLFGDIFYSLKQTDTLTSQSTYQTVKYIDSEEYELIDFEMNGYAQIHWSQNGELALIYGEDSALNEAAMKMYSFSDGCFELKGMEVESSNAIIKGLIDFPIFQWYLR